MDVPRPLQSVDAWTGAPPQHGPRRAQKENRAIFGTNARICKTVVELRKYPLESLFRDVILAKTEKYDRIFQDFDVMGLSWSSKTVLTWS